MSPDQLKVIFDRKKEKTNTNGKIVAGFKQTTLEEFQKWFDLETFNSGCHYCKLTNEECFQLYQLRSAASRGGKRGRRLELDRKNPYLHYDQLENLRWCCYWCNNAKSNFFSEAEFMPIAKEIGKALRLILTSFG